MHACIVGYTAPEYLSENVTPVADDPAVVISVLQFVHGDIVVEIPRR